MHVRSGGAQTYIRESALKSHHWIPLKWYGIDAVFFRYYQQSAFFPVDLWQQTHDTEWTLDVAACRGLSISGMGVFPLKSMEGLNKRRKKKGCEQKMKKPLAFKQSLVVCHSSGKTCSCFALFIVLAVKSNCLHVQVSMWVRTHSLDNF